MKDLLEKLDYYRKFPRFQLERHFDIILIDYIPDIINFFNNTKFSFVFPEFPVRKRLLSDNYKSAMESVSFDYAIFDVISKRIGIVELKTETESNRKDQDNYLSALSKSVTCSDLLQFIFDRIEHGSNNRKKRKYIFLKDELKKHNCIWFSDEKILSYKISPYNKRLNDEEYYSFDKIANNVKLPSKNDTLWSNICKYLLEWNEGI